MKQFAMDVAREARRLSDCPIKMGAALEKGGRILGFASNRQGSMSHGHWEYSRHAEGRVLLNKDARGAALYVYREHGLHRTPMLAKPCTRCTQLLVDAGLRTVYFSTPDGWESYRP